MALKKKVKYADFHFSNQENKQVMAGGLKKKQGAQDENQKNRKHGHFPICCKKWFPTLGFLCK
ncbi:MAG: hypothetical protein DWQ10_18115 [Calditrichaeota bacterium]|nr:MAG: hypothetical protein DWQ10_18115 [Calditrichota bacterium]